MKKTTLLYLLTGAIALVVLVLWGGLSSFQWSMLSTVLAHLGLLWWRGMLIDNATKEARRLKKELEEFKIHMDAKVDELAHRPIFPWDDHKTHLRA